MKRGARLRDAVACGDAESWRLEEIRVAERQPPERLRRPWVVAGRARHLAAEFRRAAGSGDARIAAPQHPLRAILVQERRAAALRLADGVVLPDGLPNARVWKALEEGVRRAGETSIGIT